jgi:hypothetical protein
MKSSTEERGVALLAVQAMILALLPLAAAVAMQTQLDGLMERNFRSGTEAFYAAEAGLAHALSEIGPRADLAGILNGPDGRSSTPDDGQFPFLSPPPHAFMQPPLGYDVTVSPGPANTILVRSRGHGRHGAVREIEGLIRPANAPFTPAALYVQAADAVVELGEAFLVSGIPEVQSPTEAALAGLSASPAALAAHLRELFAASSQVIGAGGPPSVAAGPRLDLESYVDQLRGRLDAAIVPMPNTTNEPLGTEAMPQLTVIDGNWQVEAPVNGFGILVVRGDVEIESSLRFHGLVVATGRLTVAETSDLRVDGALWIQAPDAVRLRLLGTGYIRYDAAALQRTDSMIAGALFHQTVVAGWREAS